MRANEFIIEAVGGDYIYHSVAQPNQIWNILRKGVIQPHLSDTDEEGGWEIPVISASRNQYYRFPYGGGSIQLVLDRNALRQAGFKVMPFSYMQFYNQADGTGPTASNPMYKQETEERIYHPRGIGIPVKKPYVLGIQIRKELMNKVPEGLLKLINDSGLELTTMRDDPTNKGTFSRKLAKPPLNSKHYYKPNEVQIVARRDNPDGYTLWSVTPDGLILPIGDTGEFNKGGLTKEKAIDAFKRLTGGNPKEVQNVIKFDGPFKANYYHNESGGPKELYNWVPPIVKTNNELAEAISRRDLLKGAAGAAALGATGLAKAGEYQDLETIKKEPDVWMPRFEQLQQRSNGMLGKLMRAAGPEWAQRLKGTKVLVMSNDQWVQGNADNRTVSLDLTVFWDAPDSTLAFAIAHELGHIALAHGAQPDPKKARQEEMDADDFAIRLCRALGYNKVEMFKFLHQKQSDYDFYNSITKLPNSSHPSYDQRINRAGQKGFQLSKGGVKQMNTLMTHLA